MSTKLQKKVQANTTQTFTPVLQKPRSLSDSPHLILQRRDLHDPTALPNVQEAQPGQPVPGTPAFFDPRFGHDFSRVRIFNKGAVRNLPIQAKLRINKPGDVYEEEADRVAEQVSNAHNRMDICPITVLSRNINPEENKLIVRKPEDESRYPSEEPGSYGEKEAPVWAVPLKYRLNYDSNFKLFWDSATFGSWSKSIIDSYARDAESDREFYRKFITELETKLKWLEGLGPLELSTISGEQMVHEAFQEVMQKCIVAGIGIGGYTKLDPYSESFCNITVLRTDNPFLIFPYWQHERVHQKLCLTLTGGRKGLVEKVKAANAFSNADLIIKSEIEAYKKTIEVIDQELKTFQDESYAKESVKAPLCTGETFSIHKKPSTVGATSGAQNLPGLEKEDSGSTPEVTPELESSIIGIRGGGQPLPESVRAFYEPRFGHDFSQVRVHTDAKAAEAARAVNARAFTVGRDVVFGAREYNPASSEGKQLLAHELIHVAQQESPGILSKDATIQKWPLGAQTEQVVERRKLLKKDRELIRFAIKYRSVWAVHQIENYKHATRDEKYQLISILIKQGWAGPIDEVVLVSIWSSFEDKIIEAASTEQGLELWKKSVTKGARLDSLDFVNKYILKFEKKAVTVAYNMLWVSEERVKAVYEKYGITEKQIQETRIVPTGMDRGTLWRRETVSHTKYDMPESQESKALAKAASNLAQKREKINRLHVEQNKYKQIKCYNYLREEICTPKITDIAASKAYDEKIRDAKIEYNKMLNEKTKDFPILAPVGTKEDKRLAKIAEGEPNQIAQIIGPMIKEVSENIKISRKGLDDNKLNVWHLDPVLVKTKTIMNVKPGLWDVLVDQKKAQVEEDEVFVRAVLSIVAGVLAIVAAIPSGGSSLMLVGSGAALGGSLGISGYMLTKDIEQYNLQKAANASDLDNAWTISNQEPSLFWLAFDIVLFGFDVLGAAKIFKSLSNTAKIATLEVKVSGESAEVVLKNADEAVETLRKIGNDKADGLGDRLANDAIDARKGMHPSEKVTTPRARVDVRAVPSVVRTSRGIDVAIDADRLEHVLRAHTIENFHPVARAAEIANEDATHLTTFFRRGTVTNRQELYTLIRQVLEGSAGKRVRAGINNRISFTIRGHRMEAWVGPATGGGMRLNSIYPLISTKRNLKAAQIRVYAAEINAGTRTLVQIRVEIAELLKLR